MFILGCFGIVDTMMIDVNGYARRPRSFAEDGEAAGDGDPACYMAAALDPKVHS